MMSHLSQIGRALLDVLMATVRLLWCDAVLRVVSIAVVSSGVVILGSLGLGAVALSQDGGLLGRFAPFVVDIEQAVPVVVSVPVAVDGGETVTATVPLTVNVALRVSVDGAGAQVTVMDAPTPAVTVAPAAMSGETLTDTLGFPYMLLPRDEKVELLEWEVYKDSSDRFAFAGKIENRSETERFSSAEMVMRFYRADGSVIKLESVPVGGSWLDPGEANRFDHELSIDMEQLESYELMIEVRDWKEAD